MDFLALFPSVTSAHPWEHGSTKAFLVCCTPGFFESSVPIHQKRPCQEWKSEIEERKDKKFIPHYVSSVSFSMKPTWRNTCIKINSIWRSGLHQVKNMQMKNAENFIVIFKINITSVPDMFPGTDMKLKEFVKPRAVLNITACFINRFTYSIVA